MRLAQAEASGKRDEASQSGKAAELEEVDQEQAEAASSGNSTKAPGQDKKTEAGAAESEAEAEQDVSEEAATETSAEEEETDEAATAETEAEAEQDVSEEAATETSAEEEETGEEATAETEAEAEQDVSEEAATKTSAEEEGTDETATAESEAEVEQDVNDEAVTKTSAEEEETDEEATAESEAEAEQGVSEEDAAETSAEEEENGEAATAETESEAEDEPEKTPETNEEQEPSAAAAAESDESIEAVEETSETVTEETARKSDEEVEAADRDDDDDDDDNSDIFKILGAAGAGLVAGALLSSGDEVVETTGDRVIVERDGEYFVRKDENELLRRPGTLVNTSTFSDGSTRTVVERDDGVRVVTIRDSNGYVVRRSRLLADGREVVLFDDTGQIAQETLPPMNNFVSQPRYVDYSNADDWNAVRNTLEAGPVVDLDRSYTLRQVRENRNLRDLMPRLDLDSITFSLGSAAISPAQAQRLHSLGRAMEDVLDRDPAEIILIEGHTDAVGGRAMNLALSDRRAESVALALMELYDIPPENLITQGYGEEDLKIESQGPERANRRVTVRRITPLLRATAAR